MKRWAAYLFLGLLLLPRAVGAQCTNSSPGSKVPDSNNQTNCLDLRNTPTDRAAPGFNPTKLLTHKFPGEPGGTASVDSALELFTLLGPGEITGNMHAKMLTKTGVECTEVGGPPGNDCEGLNQINLGRSKFNPWSQKDDPVLRDNVAPVSGRFTQACGVDLLNPPGPVTCADGDTTGLFSNHFKTGGDFFPSLINHVGFDSIILFEHGGCKVNNPTNCTTHTITASQTMKQITGVFGTLGTGTKDFPGAGDQVVQNDVLKWTTTNKGDAQFTSPQISWVQQVIDPDFSGVAVEGFSEKISGSFAGGYCQGPHTAGGPCANFNVPTPSYATGFNQAKMEPGSKLNAD